MPATNATRAGQPDSLDSLEERILRAVELVSELRAQKEAAESKLGAYAELRAENERINEELDALRQEQRQVRERIQKLLEQLDSLAE